MENDKQKNNTDSIQRLLNQIPYDAELFGKENIYPRSMGKRRTVLFRKEIEKMELGKDIVLPIPEKDLY